MLAVGKLVLVATCAVAVAGCGGSSSSTGSSSVSATQFANSQRDVGFLRAVNQSTAAFNKPPKNPTDYQTGLRELQAATHDLNSLSVPRVFATAQAHLIAALGALEGLVPHFERAARAHNDIALNNLEAQNVRDQSTMNAAFREMASVYDRCRASKFAAC
jgi:hypothetical protein